MHYVGKLDESKFGVPSGYEKHSYGYQRCSLVDHSVGSVHMGVGVCQLQPEGYVESFVQANEKGIYILDGEIEVKRGCETLRLSTDDYGLIPYGIDQAYRNVGKKAVRWFEMQAPQPKPPGQWQDTFFIGGMDWPKEVVSPNLEDPRVRHLAHFKGQKPVLVQGVDIRGLTNFRFMDREFGVQHFALKRNELAVGGIRGLHDHPVEESYFVLSGEVELELEGERVHLIPGDLAWTGVGASHAFFQKGDVPCRWIETEAPQFPTQNRFRDYAVWDNFRAGIKAGK